MKSQAAFKEAGITPVFISAAAKIGLEKLVEETWKLLKAGRYPGESRYTGGST